MAPALAALGAGELTALAGLLGISVASLKDMPEADINTFLEGLNPALALGSQLLGKEEQSQIDFWNTPAGEGVADAMTLNWGNILNPPLGSARNPIDTSGALDMYGQASDIQASILSQLPSDMQAWGEQNLGENYTVDAMLDYMTSGAIPQDDYIGQSTDIAAMQPGYFGGESIEYGDLLSYLASDIGKGAASKEEEAPSVIITPPPKGGGKNDDDDDKITDKDRKKYIDDELKKEKIKKMIERHTAKRKKDFPLNKPSLWRQRYDTGGKKTIRDFLVDEVVKKGLNPAHWLRSRPVLTSAGVGGLEYKILGTEEGWEDYGLGAPINLAVNTASGLMELFGDLGGRETGGGAGQAIDKYKIGDVVGGDIINWFDVTIPPGYRPEWKKIPSFNAEGEANLTKDDFNKYIQMVPIKKDEKKVKGSSEGAGSGKDVIKLKPTTNYNLNNNVKNTIDSLIMEGGYEHTMLKQIIENNEGAKRYISDFHHYDYE